MMKANSMHNEAGVSAAFGRIAEALGTPHFHSTVLNMVRAAVPSDLAQVYHIGRDGKAVCIDPCDTPEEMCKSYEQSFSTNCPLSRHWQRTGRPGVLRLGEVKDKDADYGNYFAEFYDPAGLVDEIGLLLPSPGQRTVALFLERTTHFSEASERQVRSYYSAILRLHRANNQLIFNAAVSSHARGTFGNAVAIYDRSGKIVFSNRGWRRATQIDRAMETLAQAPTCNASAGIVTDGGELAISGFDEAFPLAPGGRLCIFRHTEKCAKLSLDDHKAMFLRNILSRREHEVVCCILDGCPAKAIAERLGCALETVKAHKKRIYLRLDITTEREIFLMFIEHLRSSSAYATAESLA